MPWALGVLFPMTSVTKWTIHFDLFVIMMKSIRETNFKRLWKTLIGNCCQKLLVAILALQTLLRNVYFAEFLVFWGHNSNFEICSHKYTKGTFQGLPQFPIVWYFCIPIFKLLMKIFEWLKWQSCPGSLGSPQSWFYLFFSTYSKTFLLVWTSFGTSWHQSMLSISSSYYWNWPRIAQICWIWLASK